MGGTTGPVSFDHHTLGDIIRSKTVVGLHGMTVAMTIQVTVSRRLAASSADGRRTVGKGWRPDGQETVGVTVNGGRLTIGCAVDRRSR